MTNYQLSWIVVVCVGCLGVSTSRLYAEQDERQEAHAQVGFGISFISRQVDGEIWRRVDEFQKGSDRSYRCNPVTVEILFGEGDNVPKESAKILATRYRYVVGGIRSNVPAHTLTLLRDRFGSL